MKAHGGTAPKVFQLGTPTLEPGEHRSLRKTISLAQQSTRTHHPGRHRLEIVLNGRPAAEAGFDLLPG